MIRASIISMLSSPSLPITDWPLDHWLGPQTQVARKLIIPARLKWEVRDKVDLANINERTLFPGLGGPLPMASALLQSEHGVDARGGAVTRSRPQRDRGFLLELEVDPSAKI